MKQAIILKCTPQSRFHFGRVAVDANTSLNDSSIIPHSDTIFSAMILTATRIVDSQQVNDFVTAFGFEDTSTKIKISSGCYCLENEVGDWLFFLPKPLIFNLNHPKTGNHKDLKKIQFISKSVWERGLQPGDWEKNCKIIDKKFIVTNEEFIQFKLSEKHKLFESISSPKVKVHDTTKEGSFFYQTTIQFMPLRAGLKIHFYFLLETSELSDAHQDILDKVLYLLSQDGIGGERTTGCGLFEGIERQSFDLQVVDNQYFVTVSLLNPNSQAEFEACTNYQIVTRGGRQIGQSNQRTLKKVNMIAEGAVVRQPLRGRIVSIAPTNSTTPYLRNGISMTLPYPKAT